MGTVRVNLPIVFINFEAEFVCLFNTTFIVTQLSEMHGAGSDKVRSEYYISELLHYRSEYSDAFRVHKLRTNQLIDNKKDFTTSFKLKK